MYTLQNGGLKGSIEKKSFGASKSLRVDFPCLFESTVHLMGDIYTPAPFLGMLTRRFRCNF